jgi:hypothetical protein
VTFGAYRQTPLYFLVVNHHPANCPLTHIQVTHLTALPLAFSISLAHITFISIPVLTLSETVPCGSIQLPEWLVVCLFHSVFHLGSGQLGIGHPAHIVIVSWYKGPLEFYLWNPLH